MTLVDVFPCVSLYDIANGFHTASKVIGKRLIGSVARCVETTNFSYGVRVHFPNNAPLLDSISRVIGRRPDEQVGGVATNGVVAGMARKHSIRDRSVHQFRSIPVRSKRPLPLWRLYFDSSISTGGYKSGPWPARIRSATHVNLRPETLRGVIDSELGLALSAAISNSITTVVRYSELFLALLAIDSEKGILGTWHFESSDDSRCHRADDCSTSASALCCLNYTRFPRGYGLFGATQEGT